MPTAASTAAAHVDEVYAFADAVGYPLILKPRTGAGALDTTRVDSRERARRRARRARPRRLDRGRGVRRGPRGLLRHAVRARRAAAGLRQPLLPERAGGDADAVDLAAVRRDQPDRHREPDYQQLRELGRRVNEALGIGTTATHMEWFFGPKGLKFSEIGCRPPGVGAWDLYSAGNEIDIYKAWADAIVHEHVWHVPTRAVRGRHRRAAPGPRTARSPGSRASTRRRPGWASG